MGCVSGGNFKCTASPQSLFNSSTFLNSLNFLVRSYHFTFPMASCCKIIKKNSLVGFFLKPHITVTCPRKQTHVPALKGLATVLSYIFAGRIYRLYNWNDSWDFNNGRLVLKTFFFLSCTPDWLCNHSSLICFFIMIIIIFSGPRFNLAKTLRLVQTSLEITQAQFWIFTMYSFSWCYKYTIRK